MTGKHRGRRSGRGTLRLASTAALAGLLVNGCDRKVEHQGPELLGPYQLATAIEVAPPAPSKAIAPPLAASRPALSPAAMRLVAVSPPRPAPVPAPAPAMAPRAVAPAGPPTELVAAIAPQDIAIAAPPTGVAEPMAEQAPELVIPAPAPSLTAAGARAAVSDLVYIPQITDSARAAYIAQVDLAPSEQRLAVRSRGETLGAVAFQVEDGMVSVHIGQVLDLFEGKMDQARFAALRGSPAAGTFVSLERLQAAGIPITYNPAYDELVLDPERG